jgi:hypothetical protein
MPGRQAMHHFLLVFNQVFAFNIKSVYPPGERERERESNTSSSLPILTVENKYQRTVPLLNYFTRYDITKSSLLRVAESALAEGVIFVMF